MKKNLIYLACAVATLASCAKEKAVETPGGFDPKVISATCEDQTKTTLGTDGSVLWTENDKVSAFSQGTNYVSDVTTVSNEGKTATFQFNSLPSEAVLDYLIYPADAKATLTDGVVKTTLTTLQKIVPGSFANGANLAMSDGNSDIFFLNAGAFLSIKVNGEGIRSVKVSSEGAAMTGAVALSLNGETVTAEGIEGKTLDYAQLAGNFESGKTYCVVVLPGTYNGLKLEFTDNQGRKATFTNPNSITLGRNEHKLIADINIPEGKWETVSIENAINMKQSLLYPKWEGQKLGAVSQFTLETLVKFNEFGHDGTQKIYNIMGIEGTFNVRVRRDGNDGSVAGQNIIQVNAANKLTMKNDQLSTGRWYHIAVTFNNGAVDVYYDGVLKGHSDNIGASSVDLTKDETPQSGNPSCPNLFAYGYAYDYNRWFDGQIAEMRIWNKVLTAEEINAPGHFYFVDPSSEGLFSYWTLCTPKGNSVADATGRGNTLYGCGSSSARPAGINWAIDPLTTLTAVPSATSFACGADSFTVAVNASKGWTLASYPEWITPDAVSGAAGETTVNCAVAANEGAARSGEMVFTCGAREVKFNLSQDAYVACPPLTIASSSAVKTTDVFIGASDKTSDAYVATAPDATLVWTIDDNGDAWTASCSPACEGFSYNAASHTITLVIPEAATATGVNKWEIVASKTGDEGNAPLVLTAAQQLYTRRTLTAPGAGTKFGYIANEITANSAITEGTFVIVGFWSSSDGHFFLQNLWRTPHTESVWSSNIKNMTDFLGKKTLLQDLSGGTKVNQACESTFFNFVSVGEGKYAIRPYGCSNLGLGEDAEGNLVIGPEYKDCAWSFNWGGSSAKWDITLGDHHLNVDDSCTDVTGSANQRQIKIKSSKGDHCFRMYKVDM